MTAARLAFRAAGRNFQPERARPAALAVNVNSDSAALEGKGDFEGEPPEVDYEVEDVRSAARQAQSPTLQ